MLSFYKKITAILVTAMMIFVPWTSPQAHTEKAKTGLIIYQNIPEVDVKVNGNKILLRALHVHREGYFTEVTEGLRWKSSNKKVATVDDHGVVTFFGKSGKTFITVTDGMRKDCIAFAVKTAPASKKAANKT